MKTAHILIGASGSGKSTFAASLDAVICSADHYMFGPMGDLAFDPARLPQCHGRCLKRYVEAIQAGRTVAVDNTNTTQAEVAPYIALAQAYGYDVKVYWFSTVRDNVHRTPGYVVKRQDWKAFNLVKNDWPPWWPEVEVMR